MFLMALQIWDVINIIPETDVLERTVGVGSSALFSPASSPEFLPAPAQRRSSLPFSPSSPEMDGFLGHPAHALLRAGHSVLVLHRRHTPSVRAAPQRQRPFMERLLRFGAEKSSAPLYFLPLASICSRLPLSAKRLRSSRCGTQAFVYSSLILLNHAQPDRWLVLWWRRPGGRGVGWDQMRFCPYAGAMRLPSS